MIILKTNYGDITIRLDAEHTPKTAENFLNYVKAGFYDGTIFHRVIDGFMIQGGGFAPGLAKKDTNEPIENEAEQGASNLRGSVAMARTGDPHSASAQFFINVKDNPFLDFKSKTEQGFGYCVFGQVVSGIEVVDKIKAVATTSKQGYQDVPAEDVVIQSAVVEV